MTRLRRIWVPLVQPVLPLLLCLLTLGPGLPVYMALAHADAEHVCSCSLTPGHVCRCAKCLGEDEAPEEEGPALHDIDCSDSGPGLRLLHVERITLPALFVTTARVHERPLARPRVMTTRRLPPPVPPPPIG